MASTAPETGADDAATRLALLWDPPQPSGRGRRASLTLDEVVDAGIAVAHEAGLDGLSMRRIATRLGVGAMTLYTYVPGRTELVDLMVDRAFAELDLPTADVPWREALSRHAHQHFDLYVRHPWLLQVNEWRLTPAPHVLDAEEAGLRILDTLGLPARQVVEMLELIGTYVRGAARATVAELAEGSTSGMSNDDYWASISSFWTTYFDAERYPTMTRVWEHGGFDAGHSSFEGTLERLLDGVEHAAARAGA